MNKLEEGRARTGLFRSRSSENIYITSVRTEQKRRRLILPACGSSWNRRRCFLLTVTICLLVLTMILTTLYATRPAETKSVTVERDPFFFEPETKIISAGRNRTSSAAASTGNTTTSTNSPNTNDFVPRTPQCPDWSSLAKNTATIHQQQQQLGWDMMGHEMIKHLKAALRANAGDGEAAPWANKFGFGSDVALSGDGRRLAVSYEGYAGFDKAFGAHIDVMVWNGDDNNWELEQVVTAVQRHHGHDTDVRYLSMTLSKDGHRLAFSDGHGVHVFAREESTTITTPMVRPWQWIMTFPDPVRAGTQFGTHLSFNCDGTVLAVSGTQARNSFVRIYQEEEAPATSDDPAISARRWSQMGEIQTKNHGGGVALNGVGDRIAVGSVASERFFGMVQVFDYHVDTDQWGRVGQPVVGERSMELWGGQVVLSADGTTLVVSSKGGGNNRVAAYRLQSTGNDNDILMWTQVGESLHGNVNDHEYFGADIDINYDGTILAVGAPGDYELYDQWKRKDELAPEDAPFIRGRIYAYRLEIDGLSGNDGYHWLPLDNGELVGTTDGDLYGKSVAISALGSTLVGGAPRRKGKDYEQILGGAHVFHAVT